jgi:hypothetical protein
MIQLLIQDSSPWLIENWLSYDWPVYLAFLLGLLILAGIVAAAAITTSWHDQHINTWQADRREGDRD